MEQRRPDLTLELTEAGNKEEPDQSSALRDRVLINRHKEELSFHANAILVEYSFM